MNTRQPSTHKRLRNSEKGEDTKKPRKKFKYSPKIYGRSLECKNAQYSNIFHRKKNHGIG